MKINLYLAFTIPIFAKQAFGFSFFQAPSVGGLIDLNEDFQRDVYTMQEWAVGCGLQMADGVELTTYDGQDFEVVTQQDLPAGTPVLFVPNEMIFASYKAAEEFGSAITAGEKAIPTAKIPLFRLFVKILAEYEKGEDSPWYHWLNASPRLFNTGSSMTYACFECLPPYAAGLALTERQFFINFQKAIKLTNNVLSTETIKDVSLLKWAYNIANTRSIKWNDERLMAPMADMFNHGAEVDVDISYDEEGNCMAYTSRDVPAGSPLHVSLGDPANPSTLFATYGFLDESSPATFCKTMYLEVEMEELGYTYSDLLFFKETGEISMETYDAQLYHILKKNDPNLAQQFFQAVMDGFDETKNQFHEQYWQYTKEALQQHVNSFLGDLDKLSDKALGYDAATHPRVPVILKHNRFVKETFLTVKQNLDSM